MRFIIATLLILSSPFAFSQMYIDVAIKGGAGTTWLLNTNVFADEDYVHQVSGGGNFGGKLGFNFTETFQVVAEGMIGVFNQKYTIKEADGDWNKRIGMTQFQLPLLLRFNKNNGSFFEAGASYTNNSVITETNKQGIKEDAGYRFSPDYWSAILSFGGYMMGWDNLGLSLSLRFSYSFADVLHGGEADQGTYRDYAANFKESYVTTTPISAMFVLELNYDLGYLARSPCSGRRAFIFFN